MLELLWLLLPVAAASGWFLAKRECERGVGARRIDFPPDYFKGLTYLLNEQPDKAIEVFIKMVEVDSETVETHLALGNLYRRRGEVDRAIRIHQNLIARLTLDREQRTYALLELGLDYMRAGLLDRAESLLLELLELQEHVVPALQQLIDIYQQEKDWERAIATARKLEAATGKPQRTVIAHYCCEMAEAARRASDTEHALSRLREALAHDPRCVRASLIEGDIAVQRAEYREAIQAYQRVEQQDRAYLAETVAPMVYCYRALSDINGVVPYLQRAWEVYRDNAALLALTQLVKEQRGEEAAVDFITRHLRGYPFIRGFAELIELQLAHSSGVARESLLLLRDVTRQLMADRPGYKCHKCGFYGKSLYWQCPGCRNWSSIKPLPQ
jgi:lipopolysaccharide biosynthesis regulator YciM